MNAPLKMTVATEQLANGGHFRYRAELWVRPSGRLAVTRWVVRRRTAVLDGRRVFGHIPDVQDCLIFENVSLQELEEPEQ